MSTVRFRAGDIDLELSGSEPFIDRQLFLLSSFLGTVDTGALDASPVEEPPPPEPPAGDAPTSLPPAPEADGASNFYASLAPHGHDAQADAALLFAYWLQEKEGRRSLEMRDLVRCCIEAGVDTRNFNRAVGSLARRGLLETLRQGHAYRLSEQGVHAVESRI